VAAAAVCHAGQRVTVTPSHSCMASVKNSGGAHDLQAPPEFFTEAMQE